MKFLFVVQGEGRGHFTQALSMKQLLERNGHTVIAVAVGRSSARRVPRFFTDRIGAPVATFASPNFLPSGRRARLLPSIIFNLLRLPEYASSVLWLRRTIDTCGADAVINFYELLTGLTYRPLQPRVPYVCVGHQYMLLHERFAVAPTASAFQVRLLRLFSRATAMGCRRMLALSFRPMPPCGRVSVVPPLLWREVLEAHATEGDYVHGYMLNPAFETDVRNFNAVRPDVPMDFFWNKKDAPATVKPARNLRFHTIDDRRFIEAMAGCRAYATTAGFESVCEAMYLGKPVLMVPTHVEQDCNAYDAMASGAGIISDRFDIGALLDHALIYRPNAAFAGWVDSCEVLMMTEIEQAFSPSGTPCLNLQPA